MDLTRFSLDRDAARDWLTHPPRRVQGPSAPPVHTLEITDAWTPSDPDDGYLFEVLVEAAQHRTGASPEPVLAGPAGATLELLAHEDLDGHGEFAYVVVLVDDSTGAVLRLVSESVPVDGVVANGVRGVDAALVALTDAVDSANALLQALDRFAAARATAS